MHTHPTGIPDGVFAFALDTKPSCNGVQPQAQSPRIQVVSDNDDDVPFASATSDTLICSRFWSKVRKAAPDACWLWTANLVGHRRKTSPTHSRAGQFTFPVYGERRRQRHVYAHRFSWVIAHGPIPPGLLVCHHCDCPPCVNPAHLFLGTHADNSRDAVAKHRLSVPHTITVQRAGTLSLSDRLTIYRAPWYRGIGVDFAQRYGVTKSSIYQIRRGRFIGSGIWKRTQARVSQQEMFA